MKYSQNSRNILEQFKRGKRWIDYLFIFFFEF
jgi:hypothetical protein